MTWLNQSQMNGPPAPTSCHARHDNPITIEESTSDKENDLLPVNNESTALHWCAYISYTLYTESDELPSTPERHTQDASDDQT